MTLYAGQYRDRMPDLRAAGKLFPDGDRVKDCVTSAVDRPPTPEIIAKFQPTVKRPGPGEERIYHARAFDPDTAKEIRHGVPTQGSLSAGDLANPQPQTMVQSRLQQMKEKIYQSNKTAPLGRSHDQSPGLPVAMDTMTATFGRRTKYDGSVEEVANPKLSREEVEAAAEKGHNLYTRSHNAYIVGERVDRKFDWSKYPRDFHYGIETPCDKRGIHVAAAMRWLHLAEEERAAHLTSKRLDDFNERNQWQMFQAREPLKETRQVGKDHTFGLMHPPDEFGAGDLIHGRRGEDFLRGHDRLRGVVAALRHQLKKLNYQRFPDLQSAFKHYDKNGTGKIDALRIREVCLEYGLPVDDEVLLTLVDWCDADGDGLVDYEDFADFLNWRSKLPEKPLARLTSTKPVMPPLKTDRGAPSSVAKSEGDAQMNGRTPSPSSSRPKDTDEQTIMEPVTDDETKRIRVATGSKRLKSARQIDRSRGGYFTWNRQYNSVVGGVQTDDWRSYGVPTIRSDLAPPKIKRVSDYKNYGDEADAGALISPTLYTAFGVTEKDFFLARSQEEIKKILQAIGAQIPPESFPGIWEEAAKRDRNGLVSLESFRAVLEEKHIAQLELQGVLTTSPAVTPTHQQETTA